MMIDKARETADEILGEYAENRLPAMKKTMDGNTGSVCGNEQYETRTQKVQCTLKKYDTVCRWEYGIHAQVPSVEIPWPGQSMNIVRMLEATCEKHGEDVEFTDTELRNEATPTDRTSYGIETEVFVEPHPIHQHHVSYEPEETIPVCESCHSRIHNDPDFRPDLTPEKSRSEWRRGQA